MRQRNRSGARVATTVRRNAIRYTRNPYSYAVSPLRHMGSHPC